MSTSTTWCDTYRTRRHGYRALPASAVRRGCLSRLPSGNPRLTQRTRGRARRFPIALGVACCFGAGSVRIAGSCARTPARSTQNNDRTRESTIMYAVILTGGHQYRVEQGAVLRVEKLDAEPDAAVTFDQVLLIGEGEGVTVGAPTVVGASVTAKVRAHGRADKVRIVKFRRRKHHRKQMGHRQHYTEIEVTGISAGKLKAIMAIPG